MPPSVSRIDFLRPPRPGYDESERERVRRRGKRDKSVRFFLFRERRPRGSQKWLASSATFRRISGASVLSEYP